ncbi:MAG: trehalose-6-phosphate synthase [Deltaproteobacteria bacterium]|nr:trehalose-6-phosphate synthase [Deltaproteobacteria bacterium]
MNDLLIISNRSPFGFTDKFIRNAQNILEQRGRLKSPDFGQGGLVQAMSGLLKSSKFNTTWIGASMGNRDIEVTRGHYSDLFKRLSKTEYSPQKFPSIEIEPGNRMRFRYGEYNFYIRFVFFDAIHMNSYYGNFSNGFLWPLMHLTRSPAFYKITRSFPRPEFVKNDFVQYTGSSVTFANTLIDEIKKNNTIEDDKKDVIIWNQDYHLMQIAEIFKGLLSETDAGSKLKKKIHTGQFIHTPFFNIHEIQGLIREDKRSRLKEGIFDPFPENIDSVLKKISWGMLSNDFIGFHTKEYCDNYLEALEEWFPVNIKMNDRFYEVSYRDRITTVGAFPIGLDVDRILSEVTEEKKLNYRKGKEDLRKMIQADRKNRKIIFGGLERCDYTKGLPERLFIFSIIFKKLRKSGKDARFYQVSSPSRLGNNDYKKLKDQLEIEVDKINKRLKERPILHLHEGIPAPQNYRFMKEIDVMLVTPLEDGMNLVALEYILSQKFKKMADRGFLVLSTSGASRVLRQKGFGKRDGVIYINALKAQDSAEKVLNAMEEGICISDRIIEYIENERRIENWANKNIETILNCRKAN